MHDATQEGGGKGDLNDSPVPHAGAEDGEHPPPCSGVTWPLESRV